MRQNIKQTELICRCCGAIQTIWRKEGKQRSFGHLKHMYCYKCERRTPHIEFKQDYYLDVVKEMFFN